jgi:acyl-CoA synthetase (AMP-forming)/AMP-acid ligase II
MTDMSMSFSRYKISLLLLVPSIMHQLVNHPNIQNVDFSSVQVIASGAAYLPPDLAGKITSVAPQVTNVFQGATSKSFVH